MNITLNIWVVLFTCGFAMGIFLTGVFLIFHKKYATQTHNFTIALFILSTLLLGEIAQESDMVDQYPYIIGIGMAQDLLIWPFLLLYVQYITGNRLKNKWKAGLYFLPYLLAIAWLMPVILLPTNPQLAYYSSGITLKTVLLVGYKFICSFIFLIYILKLLDNRLKDLKHFFPKNKRIQFLLKIRRFFYGISLMVLVIYLLFFNNYFDLLPIGDSDRIGSLIISGFFYLFGLLVFQNPKLFEEENYSRQVKDFFKGDESEYANSLLKLFEENKVHLNENLSVKILAAEMNITNQQLSYLVNRHLGITVMDLINTYRVKEVQKSIQKGEYQQKTLLGLALDSGFNSKATFNRIFKYHTGLSPSTYIKNLEKEGSNPN